ncbi:ABC transporter substrate-binding protein [Micromonospora polyrhachis]|uniref:Peptide/nickel transport system substrate-binding protein n=1 Tax=Micromonospora polyrhachis TaxID=1282883 RepID=A0A7W7SL42_9ACTN|nr:ABC transporter substrate-binding protein [Micromonospora polyrhachis]MBB4956789.1 peptide/nickel transport system substrate-binding protein [Micromonospora polyrhachis]
MRRVLVGIGAAALVGALLAGCGSNPEGDTRSTDSIVLGVQSEPDTLNPVLGYAVEGASKIYDGLVAYDDKLEPVPALAEKLPEVSPDGQTVTFTLRPGVTFHDGTPLTADDVVFTYRAVLDEKTDSTLRPAFASIAEVTAPDQRTVVFRLKYPYAPFVKRTTLGIVPAKALAGHDVNTAPFNQRPIGTGPYKVESWTAGERLVLVANESYWGGAPAIKRVTMAFVADDNVRAARLRSGELDGAVLPPKIADGLGQLPGHRRWDNPSADYRIVSLPLNHPVTGDVAIRRAVDLAVDRDAMLRTLLNGQGKPAFGLISPDAGRWFEPAQARPGTADVAAATRALDEAGWLPGGDGIRAKGGQRAAFTLMYPASDSLRKDLATAAASDVRRIGIDVELVGLDWTAINPRLGKDAVLFGSGSPYDPDFDLYDSLHSSLAGKGYANPGRYANPAVDDLLDRARATADTAERVRLYHEVQRKVATDVPNVGLVFLHHTFVVRDAWTGQLPRTEPHDHGFNGIWWNLEDWTTR